MTIEEKIISFLNEAQSIPAYGDEVTVNPRYVVEKTGGSIYDHLCSDTVVVKSYGSSRATASNLNDAMVKLMLYELTEDEMISAVSLNNAYPFDDNTTQEYRYQAVFEITYIEV